MKQDFAWDVKWDYTGKIKEILMVEDNATTVFLNKRIIDKMEIADKLTIKNDGQVAYDYLVEKIESGKDFPDLILLDLKMPIMDGIEFLAAFRKIIPKEVQPPAIVVLTTSTLDVDKDRVEELGVSLYLNKVLTTGTAFQAISKVVTGF
ncbi:MAG: response regulator [Flavobacteriales bacterium]|nr:response regulator [Flavobacteriales bacterium]